MLQKLNGMMIVKSFSKSIILGITFGILLVGYAAFAFTPPGSTPPGDNVPAPINTGPLEQTKTGKLIVDALAVVKGLKLGEFSSLPSGCGTNPAKTGEVIFNTTDSKVYICDGTVWNDYTGPLGPPGPPGPPGS